MESCVSKNVQPSQNGNRNEFAVEMVFRTAVSGDITSGMPFDHVARPLVDEDLQPRDLPVDLASVLFGQHELNGVTLFPLHNYVSVNDGDMVVSILAKGLRGYRAEPVGMIIMPLRRAVEWLTAADLENRVGDAGQFFLRAGCTLRKDGQDEEYLYKPDSAIVGLGLTLNHLRIKRRIFDYVVEAL